MIVSPHIDGGVVSGFHVDGSEVTFDLRPKQRLLSVLLCDVPSPLTMHFLMDDEGAKFVLSQGILLSEDGQSFRAVPLEATGPGRWSITVSGGRDLRVATRIPYGRDGLDRLLCDLHAHPNIRPRMIERGHRSLMMFECGRDDGSKPIHYIIAGEDVGETSSSIVADLILRELAGDGQVARSLLAKCLLRIVPVVSLFCAARPASASYDTIDGRPIYGASKWGDAAPPPEYHAIRELVEDTIARRGLGLMLCIHSWQAQRAFSEMEFIRSSGPHRLNEPRELAATRVLEQLMQNVPNGKTSVKEKIWFPGLARDYLMQRHNVVSYRIEVTTANNPTSDFSATASQLLKNLDAIEDWTFVLP